MCRLTDFACSETSLLRFSPYFMPSLFLRTQSSLLQARACIKSLSFKELPLGISGAETPLPSPSSGEQPSRLEAPALCACCLRFLSYFLFAEMMPLLEPSQSFLFSYLVPHCPAFGAVRATEVGLRVQCPGGTLTCSISCASIGVPSSLISPFLGCSKLPASGTCTGFILH